MIIDTHCHLDDARFDDISSVIKSAFDSGVQKIIIPGADINDLPKALEIANSNENIYFAAGVHPYEIDGYDIDILRKFALEKNPIFNKICILQKENQELYAQREYLLPLLLNGQITIQD